ncbi:MAG: anhydro-N-acetylmuramic acid kinase [Chloroflexi bacterium]|nr:anhydro-N-acetylmuramic acid kinase [Chloroflexota bacterium]
MIVVGLMSGTSVDAIDAAVVDVAHADDALRMRLLGYHETPIADDLRSRIHRLFNPETSGVDEVCEVNVLLGEAFAEAAAAALRQTGVSADLVASHGQTVWHEVSPGHTRSTLQLAEPSVIAERLGVTTVADFRPRDIAAGGQGAPLASWGDALLFGDARLSRAVQNIGGIGNVTWVPPGGQWEAMLAFDTGPGNALIDHAAWRLSGGMQRFDANGAMAALGRVDDALLSHLLANPYFAAQPPKSTGRELFGAQFVDPYIDRALSDGLSPNDVVATLTAFTAHSIADQYRRFLPGRPDEVVVGGGGSRNPVLMQLLSDQLDPAQIRMHEDFGLPSLGREAMYFALLGHEALHGRPNTVPTCTGASHAVVMGKIIPGANYRQLMRSLSTAPTTRPHRLEVVTAPDRSA